MGDEVVSDAAGRWLVVAATLANFSLHEKRRFSANSWQNPAATSDSQQKSCPLRDSNTPHRFTIMSFLQPAMPSLRLLAVPRSVAVRQCLRFSTSTIRSGMCLVHLSHSDID